MHAHHQRQLIALASVHEWDPRVDGDGDVVLTVEQMDVVVQVSEPFLVARAFVATDLPIAALAMLSRKHNQRTVAGRVVFPDDGSLLVLDYSHGFKGSITDFDFSHTISVLVGVGISLKRIADEFGYSL